MKNALEMLLLNQTMRHKSKRNFLRYISSYSELIRRENLSRIHYVSMILYKYLLKERKDL
jgi:hypothetical protein